MAIDAERLAQMRANPISEQDAKRDEGLTTPEDIIRFDDICYGEKGDVPRWQLLDVYRSKNIPAAEKLPVIISVHGGGWVNGVKEVYQYYCMSLAQHGFAVINYNYRLAPEYTFPINEEDLNTVVAWMYDHADEYGFDTKNVFGVGDSAGGHILGVYANITSNSDYAKRFAFAVPNEFRFNAIGLNCAALSWDFCTTSPIERMAKTDPVDHWNNLTGDGWTTEDLEILDVPSKVTSDFPPTYIMTCVADFVVNEPMKICKRFMEEKVPFNFHFFGTPERPLHHVFHCDIRKPEATICNTETCDFFKNYMVKGETEC